MSNKYRQRMCDPHCYTVHHLIQTTWTDKLLFLSYSQSDSPRQCLSQREHHELDVCWQSFVSSLECYFAQQRKKKKRFREKPTLLPPAIRESAVRMK